MNSIFVTDVPVHSAANSDRAVDASTLRSAGSGVANVEEDLLVLGAIARDRGADSPALEVLLDRSAPEIVRARALQRVGLAVLSAA